MERFRGIRGQPVDNGVMDRRLLARPTIAFSAVLLTALLAGCGTQAPAGPVDTGTPAPTSSATPSPTATPTVTPTPTTPPAAGATPIGFGCDTLLSLQGVYDLNPNLSVVPDGAPPAGTLAATLVGGLGVACDLVHNSNGEVLRVAAATPGTDAIASLRAGATTPFELGAAGFEAFSTGNAILAFRGDLVLTAESDGYFGIEELGAAIDVAIASIG